jgi:uncharacterized membrane protein YagU involved in acid resistance
MRESSPQSAGRLLHSVAGKVEEGPGSTETHLVGRLSARSIVFPILLGGFIAGALDIGAACLINSAKPSAILHVIASGLIGKSAALDGGATTVALGLILQWAMSIIIATIFVVASRWRPVLRRRWIAAGLAYGVVVFAVMNYVVLPLSALGHAPRFRIVHFTEDILAMLLFGLIIAFFARQRADK